MSVLTLRQAATALGISRQAVAKAIATGRIPGRRVDLPTGQSIWVVERAAVDAARKPPRKSPRK